MNNCTYYELDCCIECEYYEEIIDKMISMSIIEDIKAEIEDKKYIINAERCLEIIDKHINGKDKK